MQMAILPINADAVNRLLINHVFGLFTYANEISLQFRAKELLGAFIREVHLLEFMVFRPLAE